MDKRTLNTPTRIRVFNLIVTFFNMMGMGGYGSKRKRYLRTEKKKLWAKIGHMCKTWGHLCTLTPKN